VTGHESRRMSRRMLLQRGIVLAIGGAASIVAVGSVSSLLRFGRPSAPGARLAAALPHSDGAARLGRAALASGLVEPDVPGLLAGLAESVSDLDAVLRNGSDDDVRTALDIARRREFRAHGAGVIRIDGWVVARTEARVCALIALA
jgi:hypothetical protein